MVENIYTYIHIVGLTTFFMRFVYYVFTDIHSITINETGKFLWLIYWFYSYYYNFDINLIVSVLKFSREVVLTH